MNSNSSGISLPINETAPLNVTAEERQWVGPGYYHGSMGTVGPILTIIAWFVIFYFLLYFVNFYVVPAFFGRPFFYFGRNSYVFPPPYGPYNPYMRSHQVPQGFRDMNEFNEFTARVASALPSAVDGKSK